MLCPKLATQGQIVYKSKEGVAFAFRDCDGEYENIGANAKPLRSTNPFSLGVYAIAMRHPIAPLHLSAQTQREQQQHQ